MQPAKHEHHRLRTPHSDKPHHNHRYYWKGVHRGARIWIYMLVMLAAMAIFVMRRSMRGRIDVTPRQPVSDIAGE